MVTYGDVCRLWKTDLNPDSKRVCEPICKNTEMDVKCMCKSYTYAPAGGLLPF
jgi:hypothetical protein